MTALLELAWGGRTDTGLRRTRNEDTYLATSCVFAVADGMGGHAHGDLAAAIAVDALRDFDSTAFARGDLLDAVRAANTAILETAGRSEDGSPMGTTLCGVAAPHGSEAGSLLVFNVGDSRAYRLRSGILSQLTTDHSVVQELVDGGTITALEAVTHPERHVVTRSLGAQRMVDIDWWTVDARAGDRFLVCSDGLVKELDGEQVRAVLAHPGGPQEIADALVLAALERGGRDNITVVVVEVLEIGPVDGPDGLEGATDPRALDRRTDPRATADGGGAADQVAS